MLKEIFKNDIRNYFLILLYYMVERKKYNENNIIKNLGYNMSKTSTRNTKYLITLGRIARGDTEDKVNEVINLYREGKIPQVQTAENIIIDLIYNMKNKRQQKTTTKRYDKIIAKHTTKEP